MDKDCRRQVAEAMGLCLSMALSGLPYWSAQQVGQVWVAISAVHDFAALKDNASRPLVAALWQRAAAALQAIGLWCCDGASSRERYSEALSLVVRAGDWSADGVKKQS